MKVMFTKRFPFKGFRAISLFGRMYVRDPKGNTKKWMIKYPERYYRTLEHERMHLEQQKEMLFIPFFVWYGAEWFVKLFTEGKAYKNVSFEREAYANEKNHDNYILKIVRRDGKFLRLSPYNLCVENLTRNIDPDDVAYVEFKEMKEKGYILGRKHFSWTKYVFHRK